MGNKNNARSAVEDGFEKTNAGQEFAGKIETRVKGGLAANLTIEGQSHSRRPGQSFNGGGAM